MSDGFASQYDEIVSKIPISRWISIGAGALIVYFLASAFLYGINRNYHHIVPEAIEYQNVNLAIALTESVYNLDEGHISHRKVYDTLRENGIAYFARFLEPLGVTFPENVSNPVLINNALTKASTLPPLDRPVKITHVEEIKPIEPNDVGMSEFYKVSFRIFGIRVQSFYLMYFLIFGSSVFLFYLRFFKFPVFASLLSLAVGLHFCMFVYLWEILPPEQRFGVGTPYAPRFISILGILPALHIAVEIFRQPKFSLVAVACFLVQLSLLVWLLTMRGTVLWQVLWVALIIACLALPFVGRCLVLKYADPLKMKLSLARFIRLPVFLFAIGVVGYSAYYTSSLNPLYRFSDEFLPAHMVWHSVYAGLEQHPEWTAKFGEAHTKNGVQQTGDNVPFIAAENFLKSNYDLDSSYYQSSVYLFRYRTLERVIKEAYFEFVRNNPEFVLELQFIYKPRAFLAALKANVTSTFPNIPAVAWGGIVLSLGLLLLSAARQRLEDLGDVRALLVVLPFGAAMSLAPFFATFASNSIIGDSFYMIILCAGALLCLLPVLLLHNAVRFYKSRWGLYSV